MKKYLIVALFTSLSVQAENNPLALTKNLQKIDSDQDILLLALQEMTDKSLGTQKVISNTVITHTLEDLSQAQKTVKEENTIDVAAKVVTEAKMAVVHEIKNVIKATITNPVKNISLAREDLSTKANEALVKEIDDTPEKIVYHEIEDKDLKVVGASTHPLYKSKLNVSTDKAYRDAVREMN